MRKFISIATACFMILTLCSGCGILQKLGLQKSDNDELHPVSSVVMNEDEAKKLTDKIPVHLYFATEDYTKLRLEVRYIPTSEAQKSTSNLATVIVNELIKGSTTGLKATIPSSTKLLKAVSVNNRVATVDLSKDFVTNQPEGKAMEQATIYSIVNSLTELNDIQKVKFTINGKAQKEFKGNFQFDMPFPRSAALISKSAVVPNNDSSSGTLKQDTKTKDNTTKPSDTKSTNTKSQETSGSIEENAEDTYIELTDDLLE